MEMNDVVYGSVIGNTTNPLMLEVDHWVYNTIVIEKFHSQVLKVHDETKQFTATTILIFYL